MSTTTAPLATPTERVVAATRNSLVAGAQSVPELIAKASVIDPAFAKQLTAKPLYLSKTPAGTLLAGAIGWVAAKYGFGWDQGTTDLVAGFCLLAGGYVMRYITASPIAGIFSKGATP